MNPRGRAVVDGRLVYTSISAGVMNPRGRAVVDGKLVYTSVSAMNKSRGCLRQWYYRYVERLPDDPSGAGALRGTEGHKRIEYYLRTGLHEFAEDVEAYKQAGNIPGKILKKGEAVLTSLEGLGVTKGFIPDPKDGAADYDSELPVDGRLAADGVPLIGAIDLRWARAAVSLLRDWKFKKSIKDYGVKEHELVDVNNESGVQMIGYAKAAVNMGFPGPYRLSHVTFQTQGKSDVQEVHVDVDLQMVTDLWETISQATIPRMRKAAAAGSAYEVETNTDFCWKYHKPCPYMGPCKDRAMGMMADVVKKRMQIQDVPAAVRELLPPGVKTVEVTSTIEQIPTESAPVIEMIQVPIIKADATGEADRLAAELLAKAATASTKKIRAKKQEEADTYRLYFGCTPIGVQTTTLAAYVDELESEVCARANVNIVDIRTATDNVLGFGKWKGFMSAAAKSKPPPPGYYVVYPGDERVDTVAMTLLGLCKPGQAVVSR